MAFEKILSTYAEYNDIISALKNNITPISVSGVSDASNAHLIFAASKAMDKSAIVVTYSDYDARRLYNDLEFFADDKVLFFPSKQYIFYNIEATNHDTSYERLNVLNAIYKGEDKYIVVASLDALLQYTIDKKIYENSLFKINLGDSFELENLAKQLVMLGYAREDMVEGKGQFSLRGGILDVFMPNSENPVRIEFFDTETDSIRSFDIMTQRSIDKLDSVSIAPCLEVVFDETRKNDIVNNLSQRVKKLEKKGNSGLAQTLRADIELFNQKHHFPSIDKYAGLVYDKLPSLLDYISDDAMVFIEEPRRINERSKSFEWEMGEIINDMSEKDVLLIDGIELWHKYNHIVERLCNRKVVTLNGLSHTTIDFKPKANFNLVIKSLQSFHGNVDYLYDDLRSLHNRNATVVVLSGSRTRGEELANILEDKGIIAHYVDNIDDVQQGAIYVTKGSLSRGFEYSLINFVVISDKEAFTQKRLQKKKKELDAANKIKSYTDINVGDYVVHRTHGVGIYSGLQRLSVDGINKDYLKISYQGTDSLYLPTDQLDMLYKYVASKEINIKLNKLGTSDWSKTKAKVKKSTEDLAGYLINLYAEREKTVGYAFSEDTIWQREFEDTFIYQETDDQLRSIDEVKADMQKLRPMDRLLCGDVGYGKTEVAIRAAFKAVMDSKQVAYLVPTTVLAMQQYNNFHQRMQNFPVRVEMLSRFRSPLEQKRIIKMLKTGEIDIVIGTHKILQKDIEFKDLGLLIVDEEQRFGVTHKEKLKNIKKNVDVLTMTATPIPRTLHMSMINIRDMSLLSEPPENRYPVQTYVLEYNPSVLIDAIKAELARNGQVYYLFNRVQGIERVGEWIQQALPDVRVRVAHGQMKEDSLENIMIDMQNGDIDVLVCTTIIETGLDIANVNTIIIENADRMGLSQLYQLRGRVGRSNRKAYAYLVYQKDKLLNDVAQKRLQAIREFTEFGSGFRIAMRDLELRGAGNILGAQQHGHIDAVGYDMYCRLLEESIDEAKGVKKKAEVQTTIDLSVDAFISDKYIKNHAQRIDVYKKISAVQTQQDAYEVQEEIEDRFGDIPKAVQNLIDVALAKSVAASLGIYEVTQKNDNIILKFSMDSIDLKLVSKIAIKFGSKILFSAGEKPYLTYRMSTDDKKNILSNVTFVLQIIKQLHKDNNV